jgi:hypothetical protein
MQQQRSIKRKHLHISPNPYSYHNSETPGTPGTRLHILSPSRIDARTSSPRTSMIAIISTGRGSNSPLPDCNHGSPHTRLQGEVEIPKHEDKAIKGHVHKRGRGYTYRSNNSVECVHLYPTRNGTRSVADRSSPSYRVNSR